VRDSPERGTLAVMVSGSGAAFAEVALWLGRVGTTVEFIGEKVGAAQPLKLLNNLLSMTAFRITGEAIVMGVKAGLDPEVMLRVINAGSGRNSATADKFPKAVLTRTFEIDSLTSITAPRVVSILRWRGIVNEHSICQAVPPAWWRAGSGS
jgi:3-hydroxyisobutyrate dehydrogenase-like beta-hydroxyacid dehydrogenase